MKRIIFAFCMMLWGAGAHAATMCVPDLSSCTSCTDAWSSGVKWSATCCGVRVSGVGVYMEGESALYNDGTPYCKKVFTGVVEQRILVPFDAMCISCACFVFIPQELSQGYAFFTYGEQSFLGKPIVKDCPSLCANNASTIVQNLF